MNSSLEPLDNVEKPFQNQGYKKDSWLGGQTSLQGNDWQITNDLISLYPINHFMEQIWHLIETELKHPRLKKRILDLGTPDRFTS